MFNLVKYHHGTCDMTLKVCMRSVMNGGNSCGGNFSVDKHIVSESRGEFFLNIHRHVIIC